MNLVVTGGPKWSVQGVAEALRRTPGLSVATAAPEQALHLPAEVLVVVDPVAADAARIAQDAPEALPVLWLGEAAPAARRAPQGHLHLDAGEAQLAAAVHALAAGLHVADPAAALPRIAAGPELSEPLTPRELEVFELLAKGLANREIAQALGISSHTAKFHVAQILVKTGAATRTEAVRQGLRLGLVGL
nr:LuxR C-terminal-related transcriptional regulator [Ramlibacter agri]